MPASSAHLADVVGAVRTRILSLDALFSGLTAEIGNPAQFHPRSETAPPLVTLFVYRVEPDHTALLATPQTAAAMRLHMLVTAYCSAGETADESAGSFELRILSHIIRLFLEVPMIGPVRIREALPSPQVAALVSSDIMIEACQMAPEMEEINNIWTTQGDAPYRTSLVYRLRHGIVPSRRPSDEGPPILRTEVRDTADADPTAPGATPAISALAEAPGPDFGALALNLGTAAAPRLASSIEAEAGEDIDLAVLAVTESPEPLDLVLERFDDADGSWADETARLSATSLNSLARRALAEGGPMTTTAITVSDPGAPMVLRLRAVRAADPESLSMGAVFIAVAEAGA